MPPSADDERREWDLPTLKEVFPLRDKDSKKGGVNGIKNLFDAKFYPYTAPGVDPIFAVVGGNHVYVLRPSRQKDKKAEILCEIPVETDDGTENSSLVWTKDMVTGRPWLCVSGGSALIRIYDALDGELERTLTGHGGDINDLAISPTNPEILASGSADWTIRIWNLSLRHENNPCVAILAGDAHRDIILTIAFHPNGRYLLSGGQDMIVNLWTLPLLPEEEIHTPISVFFPHFSSSEVHSYFVDCVAFHSDNILSKAHNEHCIVLWCIHGFSSSNPITPARFALPLDTHPTRSAFANNDRKYANDAKYTRLLQFDFPGGNEFYMRFSLSTNVYGSVYDIGGRPSHPILAICNSGSKVFFWDLDRLAAYQTYKYEVMEYEDALEEYNRAIEQRAERTTFGDEDEKDGANAFSAPNGSTLEPVLPTKPKRPHWLQPFRSRPQGGGRGIGGTLGRLVLEDRDDASSTTGSISTHADSGSTHEGISASDLAKSQELWGRRYSFGDPLGGGKAPSSAAGGLETEGIGMMGGGGAVEKEKGKGRRGGKRVEVHGVEAHRAETMPRYTVVGRQVAWSVGGEWCVVVGSPNLVGVFWRWEGRVLGGEG